MEQKQGVDQRPHAKQGLIKVTRSKAENTEEVCIPKNGVSWDGRDYKLDVCKRITAADALMPNYAPFRAESR